MNKDSIMNFNEVVPMIYEWMKSKHLLKTARALQEEYCNGEDVPESPISLNKVLQCFSMMHSLVSDYDSTSNNIKIDAKKNHSKKEKTKELTVKDSKTKKNNSKLKSASDNSNLIKTANGTVDLEIKAVKKTKEPKKKKEPFVLPGEWICPEMEERLGRLYDRITEVEAKNRETLVTESITITDTTTTSNIEKGEQDKPESIDSDSDSGDDVKKTRKTIVKLSNGVCLDSPYSSKKHGRPVNTKEPSPVGERTVEKKKKKKKQDSSKSNSNSKEEVVVLQVIDEEKEVMKKKKKKKKKASDEDGAEELADSNSTAKNEKSSTKKLKRKHKESVKEDIIVEESLEKELPKKKKKKKDKSMEKETDLSEQIIEDDDEKKILKKKKKEKKYDTDDIQSFTHAFEAKVKKEFEDDKLEDRNYVNRKWFYFTMVATTTIGYGDIVPKSINGKVFYIAFTILGIPLMMILLKSTGAMITDMNKKFFSVINRLLCKKKRRVSEELLSAISMLLLFSSYLAVGCVFTAATDDLSLLDGLYFWVNTFTTVGFGDIVPSLETQIDYIEFIVIYQIFGLTMLASLIDTWLSYLQYRKESIVQKNRARVIAIIREREESIRRTLEIKGVKSLPGLDQIHMNNLNKSENIQSNEMKADKKEDEQAVDEKTSNKLKQKEKRSVTFMENNNKSEDA